MKITTGTITATGSGNGVSQEMKPGSTQAVIAVGGTFTSAVFKVEGLVRGGTLWQPLLMIDRKTYLRKSGSDTPTDSTTTGWQVDVSGYSQVRVYCSSGTPTSVTVEVATGGPVDFGGNPGVINLAVTNTQSFGAGISFTGATTVNVVSIPDNLADALSISEGSNAYLTFVTTDSGELIVVKKTLKFGGTTGNNIVAMVDNLADALNIKEGSNSYLKFTTTDSAEMITIGQSVTIADAKDVTLNATTGTKIGTATTQKLGFWNATPVVQPVANTDTTTGAAGSATAVYLNTTFTGPSGSSAYTIGGIVKALKAVGILAA